MTKGRGKNPGAGGLDKHIKREAHKERSQLPGRERLGALEKHKDYVKRAGRRHEKVAKLRTLKRAAAQRNPDEFNIKMTERIVDPATGKMKKRNKTNAASERAKEVGENRKSQKYLAHKETSDHQRIQAIFDDVVGLDAAPKNTHTVFVDDDDDVATFDATKHFNTTRAMLNTPATRVNLAKVASIAPAGMLDEAEADDAEAAMRAAAMPAVDPDVELEEDEEAAPRTFAERLTAAREQVKEERRQGELDQRRQAATRMREAAERRKREVQLHELNSTLRRRTDKVAEKLKRKQSAKFKPGTAVRKR